MSKWTEWYDSLNPSTKEYLKNQPIWHDGDLLKAGLFGAVIGIIIGLVL